MWGEGGADFGSKVLMCLHTPGWCHPVPRPRTTPCRYRRGNDESGDVDMLATMEGDDDERRLRDFNNLVKDLMRSGFFTDDANAATRVSPAPPKEEQPTSCHPPF